MQQWMSRGGFISTKVFSSLVHNKGSHKNQDCTDSASAECAVILPVIKLDKYMSSEVLRCYGSWLSNNDNYPVERTGYRKCTEQGFKFNELEVLLPHFVKTLDYIFPENFHCFVVMFKLSFILDNDLLVTQKSNMALSAIVQPT